MSHVVVIGGTGYAGRHIVAEAVQRGHDVVAVARTAPTDPVPGATYVEGSALDLAALEEVLAGADVVVSALSPRGDMSDRVLDALQGLVDRLTGTSTRLGVIGGAMGSLSAPGGPRLWDLGVPEEYRHEAQVGIDSLALLEASDEGLDWFLVHPPRSFGAWVPGVRTGRYRIGGEVVVEDAAGNSEISGADLAVAIVDEIERPAHRRARFTVGY
ncbi:NAD(P)-dependent oxidoreductase [Microbacterium sp.]|uniref:NAD(P)-dependent oxidoreductase n=1 Tax=Microbacterium sp. TaxID=51671 RepID=UPI0039E4CAF0